MFKKLRNRLKKYNAKIQKYRSKNRKIIGFTLIELIVVSVVLSIFLLLAVMMFHGLIKDTRDSSRLTEIRQISTSLESYHAIKGHFPEPENSVDVVYSGSLIWSQGSFGDSALILVGLMSNKPVDTLTKTEYAYSVANNKDEFQLGVVIEGNTKISSNVLSQTYAGDRLGRTYTVGNYNGYVSSICSSGMIYVFSLPSILSNDLIDNDVVSIIDNQSLAYKGYNNLPETYKDTIFDVSGGFDFAPSNFVVYAGDKEELFSSGGLKVKFLKDLQQSYIGTNLETVTPYKEILKIDTNNINDSLITYINKIFSNDLCGDFVSGGNTEKGGTGIKVTPTCGSENGRYYNFLDAIWSNSNFCGIGTSNPVSPAFPASGASSSWQCNNDGKSVSCSANRLAPIPPVCGAENLQSYNYDEIAWSSTSYCGTGTSNPISPLFPAEGANTAWQCDNDGISVSCSANRLAAVPSTCGTQDGQIYNYNDSVWSSSDYCGVGASNPVSPIFPLEGASTAWNCENDGISVSCSADRLAPIAPTCGSENGVDYSFLESSWSSSNFCGLGSSNPVSPIFPLPGTSTTWNCDNDGISISCSANRLLEILPVCGTENGQSYYYSDVTWSGSDFCDLGTANPVSPAFPAPGTSTSWQCNNDGNTVSCSAERLPMFVTALFGGDSRGLAEDPSGKIWIASKNGVGVLSGGAIDNIYDESDGLADNQTRSIIVDSSGNYWIATLKGISYFDGTNWITYDVSDGVASNDTVYLYEDSSGNIWTATNKGVSVFDGTNWTTYDQGDGLINKEVNCITQTLDGNMWFGTQHGVSKYDGSSWTDIDISDGLPDNEVLSCYADNLGYVWFGTKDGVGRYDGSNRLIYNQVDGLADKFVQTIIKDTSGVMWFGTHAGLSKLDSGTWTTFTKTDGLTDNDIQFLFQDSTGAIWIATKNGVSIYY